MAEGSPPDGLPSIICDLDGVVYRGDRAISGSAGALQRIVDSGLGLVFATNNSTRTRSMVRDKIRDVVGFDADEDSVVTSAEAAMEAIPSDVDRVLVVGGAGIRTAIELSERSITDDPAEAQCVVVGVDFSIDYETIAVASEAIRRGAVYIATNGDKTYPTADGLLPGAGSIVAAISAASGTEPIFAGKPCEPMRRLIKDLIPGEAWVIGDRIDTDIAMADAEDDWRSVLVHTGVTPPGSAESEVDLVAADLTSAVDLVLSTLDRQ